MAPPNPKTRVQSLPPILRRAPHNSLIGYSKGARGLSVLWRASGVFTGTTNSPGGLLRQSSDRYAIRAGRNLPDKEFRSSCLFCFQSRWTLSYASCVYRRSYRPDFFNAFEFQMFTLRHQVKNLTEPREVDPFF